MPCQKLTGKQWYSACARRRAHPFSGDPMARACGSEAIVIGAGMGGLAAAMALSRHFEHVTVLDRDKLPSGPEPRIGTPQAWHTHALLLSGQRAWEELY